MEGMRARLVIECLHMRKGNNVHPSQLYNVKDGIYANPNGPTFIPHPLPILNVGDSRLEMAASEVHLPDSCLSTEIDSLHATLEEFRQRAGYGRAIAAPQTGIMKRVVAMNLGAGRITLINPEITWRSDDCIEVWDDCLSVSDKIVRVRRHRSISIVYRDEQWRKRVWNQVSPDLSELLQHEIDHLKGILMLSRAVAEDAIRPIAEWEQLVAVGRPAHRLSVAQIARASGMIDPVFRDTPQYESDALNEALNCRITLKVETVNPIRSFKGRGTDFLLQELDARGETRPLVCASAGNFGQALAYSGRKRKRKVIVFASSLANPGKLDMVRSLGADLRIAGRDFDAAKATAKEFAAAENACMVEDGQEPEISEGAGTIAVELLAADPAFDHLLLPVGNGALLNGCARWFKAASPGTIVLGVVAAGADCMRQSFERRSAVQTDSVRTIADGIAVRAPIPMAVSDMCDIVDDIHSVDDAEIIEAMRLLYRTAALSVEPAAAAGLAAVLAQPEHFAGKSVALVLTGAHLTEAQLQDWVLGALSVDSVYADRLDFVRRPMGSHRLS
jgi:threonine dehydratase/peptide deformylase